MPELHIGDRVKITVDTIPGVSNRKLNNTEGIVIGFDASPHNDPFAAVKVKIVSDDDTDGDWWFQPDSLELVGYPTDEEVAEAAQRTVELERSLRGAIDAHAERESRES